MARKAVGMSVRGLVPLISALGLLAFSSSCGGGGGGGSVPFRINVLVPADAAANIPLDTTVEVAFSHVIDQATVQNGVTFFLTDINLPGSPLPGSFSYGGRGKVMIFTPSAPLGIGMIYQVDVTAGILDTAGNPLDLAENLMPVPSSFETEFVVDTTPPVFAGAVSATPVGNSNIRIAWNPATDDTDPSSAIVYNVYSAVVPGGQDLSTPDSTSPAGATTEMVGGLQTATTYYFIVRAQDTSRNEDTNLVEVSATTGGGGGDVTPPAFGGATGATALGTTRIRLTWNAATDNVDPSSAIVYNIYLATASGGQNFLVPDFVSPPGAMAYVATALQPATTYHVVVRAQDTSGNEDSNQVEVSARTFSGGDITAPTFGGATGAVAVDTTSIRIDWSPASDDTDPASAIVYNIYTATVPGGQDLTMPDFTTPPGVTSEVITGVSPDTGCYVVVRAQDTSGNEDANQVEVQGRPLVSFGTWVLPIFTTWCAAGNCHSPPNPKKKVDASSYAGLASTCINVPSGQSPLDFIEPGDSTASYLMHKIDGTQGSVGGRGGQMAVGSPSEADLIRAWIDQGALNN